MKIFLFTNFKPHATGLQKKHAINVMYDVSNKFYLTVLGMTLLNLPHVFLRIFRLFYLISFNGLLWNGAWFHWTHLSKYFLLKFSYKWTKFEVIILISDILRYLILKWGLKFSVCFNPFHESSSKSLKIVSTIWLKRNIREPIENTIKKYYTKLN